MFKIEYNLEINDNGDYHIKLADDYNDIIEHKILYLVMARHLFENMITYYNSTNTNIPEKEKEEINITIETITALVQEVESYLKTNNVKIEDKKEFGFVSHTVESINELQSFNKGDFFGENSYVKSNTIFYCLEDKNMYIFRKNKWIIYINES